MRENFKSWMRENRETLKQEYSEYKSDMKLEGWIKEDILSFTEWATERYNSFS